MRALIPNKWIRKARKDPSVLFMLHDGTAATRTIVWQAIHVFCQHTANTSMPAGIVYPGVVDPGVNVALPLIYLTYQGLIHLLSCLSVHPSGADARGAETILQIQVQGQPDFSITV